MSVLVAPFLAPLTSYSNPPAELNPAIADVAEIDRFCTDSKLKPRSGDSVEDRCLVVVDGVATE